MDDEKWIAWQIQTSKRWSDMDGVLKFLNIDFIDYDHKILVEYAFKLNQILDQSENKFSLSLIDETKSLLTDLLEYAKGHFSREEKFMDLYDLPNSDSHKREHNKIIAMLNDSFCSFNSGKVKLTRKLKSDVMDWLIKHINTVDYNFFDISNWSRNIANATGWNDIKPIIRLVGINEIDSQHQKLTEIALDTMRTISDNPSDYVIEEECTKLKNYATYHFDYESQFMRKYNIKDAIKHIEVHEELIKNIEQYSAKLKQDVNKLDEMKEWILTWWITHINSMDKDYFSHRNWAYQLIEKAEKVEDVLVVLRRTGIEEIDNEHIMLMSITFSLNSLINTYEHNQSENISNENIKKEVLAVMDKTYYSAKTHFEREERIMKSNQMDDYCSHRAEHEEILKKISNLKENYEKERLYLSSNLKAMILEWWIQHTNTTDFKTFGQNYMMLDKPIAR